MRPRILLLDFDLAADCKGLDPPRLLPCVAAWKSNAGELWCTTITPIDSHRAKRRAVEDMVVRLPPAEAHHVADRNSAVAIKTGALGYEWLPLEKNVISMCVRDCEGTLNCVLESPAMPFAVPVWRSHTMQAPRDRAYRGAIRRLWHDASTRQQKSAGKFKPKWLQQ